MPGSKPRVFLDSSVVFSGLYSPGGETGIMLEHFVKGNISVVVSQHILEEVIRTIKEKLPDALPALRRFLISIPPEVAAYPKLAEVERWKRRLSVADAAILAAVVAAQPDYFVTGGNHFVENPGIGEETGLHIVTPAQFLKLVEREEAKPLP